MKRILIFIFVSILSVSAGYAVENDGTNVFTYATDENAAVSSVGWGRYVDHDVAILINNPTFVGFEITGISVDIPTKNNCECAPEAKGFITSELVIDQDTYKNVPDIMSADGVITNVGTEENPIYRLDINFAEPYKIPEEGVYVGYTVTVTKLDSWSKSYPVNIAASASPQGGLFMHMGYNLGTITPPLEKNISWLDCSEDYMGVSTMRVILKGQKSLYAGSIVPTRNVYAIMGEEHNVEAKLSNYGGNSITSVDYTVSIKNTDLTFKGTIVLDSPLKEDESVVISIPVIAPDERGDFYAVITTDGFNDNQENVFENKTTEFPMLVRPWIPRKRVLMEEYTGTWCGWCPEVFVNVNQLKDSRPDDFVSIVFHCDDSLETISSGYRPNSEAGCPSLYFDRDTRITAFGNKENTLDNFLDVLPPADINVDLFWKDNSHSELIPVINLHFLDGADPDQYRVVYALVVDGLTGYNQRNFYTTESSYTSDYYKGKYWDLFIGQPFEVSGLTFDDIALIFDDARGNAMTLPDAVAENETYSVIGSLPMSRVSINLAKDIKNVVRNDGNFRVVAALLDANTKKVLNANTSTYSAHAPLFGTGIEELPDAVETALLYTEYYSLNGIRLSDKPETGAFIEIQHFEGGEIRSEKKLQLLHE